ncbi:Linear gramicidin synthase subunit C, partial [Frankliniella fusca]
SSEEELLLVKTRIKYNPLFTGRRGNANAGWSKVIQELGTLGVKRSNDKKIIKKWSALLTWYKEKKDPSLRDSGRGTEDGDITDTADNELFTILHDFVSKKHIMNPPLLSDSSMEANLLSNDPDNATGRSSYLGLDHVDDDSVSVASGTEEYLCSHSSSQQLDSKPGTSKGQSSAGKRAVEVNTDSSETDSCDDPPPNSTKASRNKLCSDYYKKKAKTSQHQKKKKTQENEEEWYKQFLEQQAKNRQKEHAELINVLSGLIAIPQKTG